MEKSIKRARLFWKSMMFVMLISGFVLVGYTAGHVQEQPQLPDEMVMPLISQKVDAESARKLIDNFSKIRTLSEDYLLEKQPAELASIESKLNNYMVAINSELDLLSHTDDTGMEILVANLVRLKKNFEKDMQLAFRLHRMELGLEG